MPNRSTKFRDALRKLKVAGEASVLHKPGAVRLDDYPLLVYAPDQWGEGVCCENNGATVAKIAMAVAESSGNLAIVAQRFGVSEDHVAQAARYAMEAGFLA